MSDILNTIKKNTSTISKIVAVMAPVAAIVYGVHWYLDNIWQPRIKLDDVNYEKLVAKIIVNGHERVLYAGSTIAAGFGWGVRFAGINPEDPDRIEVTRYDLTYKTISTKDINGS